MIILLPPIMLYMARLNQQRVWLHLLDESEKKKKIKRTLFNHTKNADKLSRAINLDEKWHRPTSGGSGARHGARVKAHRDVLGGRCGINKLSEARKAKESNSSKLKQDLMSEICLFPQSKAKVEKTKNNLSRTAPDILFEETLASFRFLMKLRDFLYHLKSKHRNLVLVVPYQGQEKKCV